MRSANIYEDLRKHLDSFPTGYPKTEEGFEIELLKKFFTPEEAEIAVRLPLMLAGTPKSAREVANEMQRDVDEVEKMLETMVKKCLVYGSGDKQSRAFSTLGFRPGLVDFNPDKFDAEFAINYEKYYQTAYAAGVAEAGRPLVRTVPVSSSTSSKTKIHPYEDVVKAIEDATSICLLPCYCRTQKKLIGEACERPINTCLILNEFAEYLNEIGKGRKISKEEAIRVLKDAEDSGLIHCSNNSHDKLHGICSCCGCCCVELQMVTKMKLPGILAKSDFRLIVDADMCTSCEACIDFCWFDALKIENQRVVIDHERCMGCGRCVGECPAEAFSLERKPQEEIEPAPRDIQELFSQMGWRE